MLATWGYTGPDDQKLAQSYGYPVFNQQDLISFLEKQIKTH
jgi:hypothetical protein